MNNFMKLLQVTYFVKTLVFHFYHVFADISVLLIFQSTLYFISRCLVPKDHVANVGRRTPLIKSNAAGVVSGSLSETLCYTPGKY